MKKYFTKADFLICALVVLICLLGTVFGTRGSAASKIVVEVDGRVYAEYDTASLSSKPEDIEIKTKFGRNVLRIDKDGAKMVYADCPNQIDVKQGKITKPGQTVVCAPHRLVVYIEGKSEFDAVSS